MRLVYLLLSSVPRCLAAFFALGRPYLASELLDKSTLRGYAEGEN